MIKNLVILVVAVVVLAGILFLNRGGEGGSKSGSAIESGLKSKLDGIQIASKTDTAFLTLKNNIWTTDLHEFPADTGKVQKVLTALFNLKDEEVVSRNMERASEYGLDDDSKKRVTLQSGGKVLAEVLIGKTASTDFNSTYWKRVDGEEIYRTLGNFSRDVIAKSNDWINKKLFEVEKDDVLSFNVSWKDSTGKETKFAFKRAGDKWEATEPMAGGAKPAVETMVNRIASLQFEDFVTDADSLDHSIPPTFHLQFTTSGGGAHELVAQKGKDNHYAKYPKREDLIKIANWRLGVFEKTWEDVYEPKVEADSANTNADTVSLSQN